MAVLVVTVRPGAKRPGVRFAGDEANEAVRRALADAAEVPLHVVTLARGGASKHKAFDVAGVERPALFARLRAAAEAVAGRAPSKDA